MYISYQKVVSALNLYKGDVVAVSSDILKWMCICRENHETFDPNLFIDSLQKHVGPNGTVLFQTFNWGFCRGEAFDYRKTPSECGSLTNCALRRGDFRRTKHPVYSLAVWGRDQEHLCNLTNVGAFASDSPFGYLYTNRAKFLFVGIHHRVSGFPVVHYAEEVAGVSYRFHKNFTAPYTDAEGNTTSRTYSMYVRNLEMTNGVTQTSPALDNILIERQLYQNWTINGIYFGIIDVQGALDIMIDDLRKGGELVFPTWSEQFLQQKNKLPSEGSI